MFITFEAIEGAGKSTQARRLVEALSAKGHDVILTREPGGSPLAEELRALVVQGAPDRMDPLTELLIFTAARRDHIRRTIKPALDRGAIVVCDRYLGSTHALQGAGGTSAEIIDLLHDRFCGLMPDLTIFLDMDHGTALSRASVRLSGASVSEGRFEAKGSAFHAEVDRKLREQCASQAEWQSVPASGSIDEVAYRILSLVETRLEMSGKSLARIA